MVGSTAWILPRPTFPKEGAPAPPALSALPLLLPIFRGLTNLLLLLCWFLLLLATCPLLLYRGGMGDPSTELIRKKMYTLSRIATPAVVFLVWTSYVRRAALPGENVSLRNAHRESLPFSETTTTSPG